MKYEKSKAFFDAFNSLFAVDSETREQAVYAYPHNTSFTAFIIDKINKHLKHPRSPRRFRLLSRSLL